MTALLTALLGLLTTTWVISDVMLYLERGQPRRSRTARVLHRWLTPMFLPAAGIVIVLRATTGPLDVGDGLYMVGCILAWIMREKDDDDDWKRLLRRAAGRVKNLGHRLTVVAMPAGAA